MGGHFSPHSFPLSILFFFPDIHPIIEECILSTHAHTHTSEKYVYILVSGKLVGASATGYGCVCGDVAAAGGEV